jgi:cytochrome c-type biogenesis protein
MPLAFALLAGALATLNPCGFVLLPAFLSYSVGIDAGESHLLPAPTRILRGTAAGLLVTVGLLAIYAVVGIPLSLGATELTEAMPWVGLAVGLAMTVVAVATLANRQLSLPMLRFPIASRTHGASAMLLFGVGYGLASVGCTLPVFLVAVGASMATRGGTAVLAAFGAYALGMALMLVALSIGAALLRDGLARALKRALPHLRWVTGALLLLVGAYLVYYWAAVLWMPPGALAVDPVIAFSQHWTFLTQAWADAGGGRWLVQSAAGVVVLAALVGLWQWGNSHDADLDSDHLEQQSPDAAAQQPTPETTAR